MNQLSTNSAATLLHLFHHLALDAVLSWVDVNGLPIGDWEMNHDFAAQLKKPQFRIRSHRLSRPWYERRCPSFSTLKMLVELTGCWSMCVLGLKPEQLRLVTEGGKSLALKEIILFEIGNSVDVIIQVSSGFVHCSLTSSHSNSISTFLL